MGLFLNLDNDIKSFQNKKNVDYQSYDDKILKESYKLYNDALDMIKENCFTTARNLLNTSNDINQLDECISTLLALIEIKFCNFDRACELLYILNKDKEVNLVKSYLDILISDEFKGFLEYYNLGISAINDEKYEYGIDIFSKINNKEEYLIEPYINLYLLYDFKNYIDEKQKYIDLIKKVDKDNDILLKLYKNFDKEIKDEGIEHDKKVYNITTFNKKNIMLGILLLILPTSYLLLSNKFEYNNEKASKFDETNKVINEINQNTLDKKENEENIKIENDNDNQKIIKTLGLSESELITRANDLKEKENYKEAIDIYKVIIDLDKNKEMVSECIYQVALINESIKNHEESKEYYQKYIDDYSTTYPYYDESYYNLAMIYYNSGDIEQSKKYLSQLVIKDPNSIYNNSKTNKILNEE